MSVFTHLFLAGHFSLPMHFPTCALRDRVLGLHSLPLSDDKLFIFTYVMPTQLSSSSSSSSISSSSSSSTASLDVLCVSAQPGSLTDQ